MPLTLETVFNFESGTFGECGNAKNSPLIVTTPSPPYRHEIRTAVFKDAKDGPFITSKSFAEGLNDYAIGLYVRFTNINPSTFGFAVIQSTAGDIHLGLSVNDGKLEVRDADFNVVATSAVEVFRVDTYHLVELLFTFGDPGDVIVHVDLNEAVTATGEKFDSGAGTALELYVGGQGGPPVSGTWVYCPGGYIFSGASSVAEFVSATHQGFGCLTYRHDEDSAVPDVGDNLDNGTWADTVDFNDATYGEYTTVGDAGVVTTDYGGGSEVPGPYQDSRIGPNDEIVGASWLVRRGTNTFIFRYGKTRYDEPDVDKTTGVNLGSKGVITSHLIVSEAAADVPTTDEHFQHGCESVAPGGFPPSLKMYGCLCSLFLKVGARGVTLGGGYGSRGKDVLVG